MNSPKPTHSPLLIILGALVLFAIGFLAVAASQSGKGASVPGNPPVLPTPVGQSK
jgi:hypothetical protein